MNPLLYIACAAGLVMVAAVIIGLVMAIRQSAHNDAMDQRMAKPEDAQ